MFKVSVVLLENFKELDIRESILEASYGLFHKYGIRSVSMDDIARELTISKKTIYQYFKDKDDLVSTVTKKQMDMERREIEEIEKSSVDAIDELAKMSVCVRKNLKEINPSLLFDLQKYHRKAWNIWTTFKNDFIKNNIVKNLNKGIRDGFFRKEINVEVLAIFRVEQVQMAFDDNIYPKDKFELTELQMQLFDHFIYGLLTDKGRCLYKDYQEKLHRTN